jgi:predicted O-methyltransferase YrrM
MNAVLKQMLESKIVTDGRDTYPLHSNMKPEEGALIQRVIETVRPSTTLEVGMAYGVSTLYFCDALARLPGPVRHIAIDPVQSTDWRGIGHRNVREAGYGHMVEVIEEGSELALPRLLSGKTQIEVGLIDGWHTFDHALIDFFYINKMLAVGGIVILDDVGGYESIHRLVCHILTYPAYRLFGTVPPTDGSPSLMGRARRLLSSVPGARRVLNPNLLERSWDKGWGSCVAVQKVTSDKRSWDWHEEF